MYYIIKKQVSAIKYRCPPKHSTLTHHYFCMNEKGFLKGMMTFKVGLAYFAFSNIWTA